MRYLQADGRNAGRMYYYDANGIGLHDKEGNQISYHCWNECRGSKFEKQKLYYQKQVTQRIRFHRHYESKMSLPVEDSYRMRYLVLDFQENEQFPGECYFIPLNAANKREIQQLASYCNLQEFQEQEQQANQKSIVIIGCLTIILLLSLIRVFFFS